VPFEVEVDVGVLVIASSVAQGHGGGVMVRTSGVFVPVTLWAEVVMVKGGGLMLLVMENDNTDAIVSHTVTA
jgi:hypothetical protein